LSSNAKFVPDSIASGQFSTAVSGLTTT
jgi:hypothetical protein